MLDRGARIHSSAPLGPGLRDPAPGDGVVDPQHDDGADDGHDHAPQIETGDAGAAERTRKL